MDEPELLEPLQLTDQALPDTDKAQPLRLSFSFAQAHGVILDNTQQPPCVLYRSGLKLDVLRELRRFIEGPLQTLQITDAEFQQRLTRAYQTR